MKKYLILILLAFGLISTNAYAQRKSSSSFSAETSPTYHNHEGFFLYLGYGAVFGSSKGEVSGENFSTEVSGNGGVLDVKLGGIVSENLALHATVVSAAIVGPKIKITGYPEATASDDVSFGEVMFGVGLTYYIMPSNAYISGSIGAGKFVIDNEQKDAVTDAGLSFQLKAGYDFWISSEWALGINASYMKTNLSNEESGYTEDWDSNRFSIGLNFTYN